MPRRWSSPQTRAWAYRYLVLRDGEKCALCGKVPKNTYSLDIDHIDRDPTNTYPHNLRLLCRSCNVAEENRKRPSDAVCVGVKGRERPGTRIARDVVPYYEGSPEMQANALFEVRYRHWLQGFIDARGFIPKKEAVNAGAEAVGCSPATAARYLAKLTSYLGPLKETKDMLGEPVVTSRADDGDCPPGCPSQGEELARRRGGRLAEPSSDGGEADD